MKQIIKVLVVDDDESYREGLKSILEAEGYEVKTVVDGITAINIMQSSQFDLILLDIVMPIVSGMDVLKNIKNSFYECEVVMLTGENDIHTAVESIKLGAYDYLLKPCSGTEILNTISRAVERKRLLLQNKALKTELARVAASTQIVTQNPAMLEILNLAMKVAPTDATVLIQGESGTGKELIANYIHSNSLRKEQPFVVLNCASMQETLLESELFGHEKGAFTDASKEKQGLVEIANGGTLFLDEIGEISPVIQPKLLRFVQSGEYRRLGGTRTLQSDVRILSATNKNLIEEVKQGRFREDLLYRMNVFTLELPPLRNHKEDIPFLVDNFLKRRYGKINGWEVAEDALTALRQYEWPGNVRELENVIERATIVADERTIQSKDLAVLLRSRVLKNEFAESGDIGIGKLIALREIEKVHISGVLNAVGWDKNLAAKILDINIKTLYIRIQTYGLTH
ncbi:MAG: sigma-54 dependent transcriptional regulator [Bacteroidota bacterium]